MENKEFAKQLEKRTLKFAVKIIFLSKKFYHNIIYITNARFVPKLSFFGWVVGGGEF